MNQIAQVKEFFNQWDIYKKVVQNNYMAHKEIYEKVYKVLSEFFAYPFSLLDLGCGDALCIAEFLNSILLEHYYGIDISDVALEDARINLSTCSFGKSLVQGDFLHSLDKIDKKLDVILAGFSLHHLTTIEKSNFIGKCYCKLKEKGIFLLLEPIRKEKESREKYFERYFDNCKKNWNSMTCKELDTIYRHITNNDYPESSEFFCKIAKKYNFKRVESLFLDKPNLHELVCFYR